MPSFGLGGIFGEVSSLEYESGLYEACFAEDGRSTAPGYYCFLLWGGLVVEGDGFWAFFAGDAFHVAVASFFVFGEAEAVEVFV